jgi:hypothetical protein
MTDEQVQRIVNNIKWATLCVGCWIGVSTALVVLAITIHK